MPGAARVEPPTPGAVAGGRGRPVRCGDNARMPRDTDPEPGAVPAGAADVDLDTLQSLLDQVPAPL
jgi:hypothetical protein